MKLSLLFFILFSLNSFAENKCLTEITEDLEYAPAKVRPINRPVVNNDSEEEIVFIAHGFLGSPFEMSRIADVLNENGYSTYLGLIPGYGYNAVMANKYTRADYRIWYEEKIQLLEQCFSKVHLVGFSTGALLAHDYISLNPADDNIKTVSLISPFFMEHSWYSSFLRLATSFATDEVSIPELYKRTNGQDLRPMILKPEAYLQAIPMKAANQVIRLGLENTTRKTEKKSKVPALVFVSDADNVIDQWTSIDLTQKLYKKPSIIQYSEDLEVPHHVMSELVSPVYEEVEQSILEFIWASH